jgi:hypothetical protein
VERITAMSLALRVSFTKAAAVNTTWLTGDCSWLDYKGGFTDEQIKASHIDSRVDIPQKSPIRYPLLKDAAFAMDFGVIELESVRSMCTL